MSNKAKNQGYLVVFCALIGAFAGVVLWLFFKIMAEGTHLLWETLPEQINSTFYPLAVCVIGAGVIGLIRRKYGDYPEELSVVMGKVKKEKAYDYKKMPIILICALIPLLIGSSVGPEAGMVGIIVGLCYWAGDNLKFAGQNAKEYSKMGMEISLSVLFHSPLFGFFAVEEGEESELDLNLTKSSKLLLYGIALAGATAIYMILSRLFGAPMSGFPSFELAEPETADFLMFLVYVFIGCVLAAFYDVTHHGCHQLAGKLPPVIREMAAGVCLGLAGVYFPMLLFSGEEEMGALMAEYMEFAPLMLIGTAFFKVLLTNICIQMGLKGGHFFPLIFSGVCMGYGVAMLVLGTAGCHVLFGAAVTTAAMLGRNMKKPIAVTMLLFLCFPVKMFLWIFLAAVLGSRLEFKKEKSKDF